MNLKNNEVEWVVNEMGELGVKIKDQFFFMYKGESYSGGESYRPVFKREFGETCYPWKATKDISRRTEHYFIEPKADTYICHLGEDFSEWKRIRKTKE